MKQNDNHDKLKAGAPIFDFISGNTSTLPAKGLTKNISNMRSLWLLAKMSGTVKKYKNE